MEIDFLLRAFAPSFVITSLVGLLLPFLVYAVARWRAHREPVVDAQLGLKVALGFFALAAFQLALLGATLIVYTVLSNGEDKGEMYRTAFGLLVPAAIVLGVHVAVLGRTNQAQFPSVRRLYLGFNLCITGAVGLIALVLAFEALFKRGSAGETGRIAGAMTLVYGGAWAALGWQFGRSVLGGYAPPSGPPAHVVLSSQPPASQSQPTLPKLGGGSYPPVEKK